MQKNLKKYVFVAILSAMSFVLFLFPKFPLFFPWLDMDLSDVPALFASVTLSPVTGLCVVLLKNILHLPVTSTAMVGELSNLLINGTFVLVTGLVYRFFLKADGKVRSVILSAAGGSVFQVVAAVLVNYYIMIPMYAAFVNFDELGGAQYYILAGVVPFNIIKDVVASVMFVLLFRLVNRKLYEFLNK